MRVDYVRVPGSDWVSDPENRFTTIDMRGPLLQLVTRAVNAVADDLPKGFVLPEGEVQAKRPGLPSRVLREAIVNALMHRSYGVHGSVLIVRYSNRIEIINPGYSIVEEDRLGEPGSQTRNPKIAAVFHDTNYAETKGSGIRVMRNLMQEADFAPPTFESDRLGNRFSARLLLHHFLSPADLRWLAQFDTHSLSEHQKKALIFVREAGAVDNLVYRQINGVDTLHASNDLRRMRDRNLLEMKGKGAGTYYIPSGELEAAMELSGVDPAPVEAPGEGAEEGSHLVQELPPALKGLVQELGQRANSEQIREAIQRLCTWRPLRSEELGEILGRRADYLVRKHLSAMEKAGELSYTIPEMPNHPDQAYTVPPSAPDAEPAP